MAVDFVYYILDNTHQPVRLDGAEALHRWSEWMWGGKDGGRQHRLVAYGQVGPVSVSTVFVGTDQGYGLTTMPMLFKSTIFWPGSEWDQHCTRYAAWDEALAGHKGALSLVRARLRALDT